MEFVGYIIGIMLIVIVVYAIIRELFILLVSFLEGIFEFVADVALTAYHTDPMLSFFVLSIIFYLIAYVIFLLSKPHPVEAYLREYKKGRTTLSQAKLNISKTITDRWRDKKSSWTDKYWVRKTKKYKRQLEAENDLLEEVEKNIRLRNKGNRYEQKK